MVKIIFSDIDGTLINDALKVMPRTRDRKSTRLNSNHT